MRNWPKDKCNFYAINCSKEEKVKIVNNSKLEELFYVYAKNYKEAAKLIVEDALESNSIATLDINFFGLAFLYRHSLELLLKAIGFKHIKDEKQRKKFVKETFHNLYDITKYISEYIADYIKYDEDSYKWIMKIFDDMNSIDKESDSFRYPFELVKKKKGGFRNKKEFTIKLFFDEQSHIDLKKFANKMEIIFYVLNGYYVGKKQIVNEHKEYSTTFLEQGGEYYAQSVIGDAYNRGKFDYNVSSYKNCADILYNIINSNIEKKNLFIPLCYLYRNSIELSMKEILCEESSYKYQDKLQKLNDNKHKLYSIWNEIKDDVRRHAQVEKNDKTLLNIEAYIKMLNDIDGGADLFRYPCDKHLNIYFRNAKFFDIDNVRDFFEDILTFMRCVCDMMSEQNEALREIEYENRSDY